MNQSLRVLVSSTLGILVLFAACGEMDPTTVEEFSTTKGGNPPLSGIEWLCKIKTDEGYTAEWVAANQNWTLLKYSDLIEVALYDDPNGGSNKTTPVVVGASSVQPNTPIDVYPDIPQGGYSLGTYEGETTDDDIYMQSGLEFLELDLAHNTHDIDGRNVRIAVLDTGIDIDHAFFQGKYISYEWDLKPNCNDVNGHGTAVAGIILTCAPDAQMIPIKLSDGGTFDSDTFLDALDWCLGRGIDIINLSVRLDQDVDVIEEVIQDLLDASIVVCAAAGNDGGDVSFPANFSNVQPFAAVNNSDYIWTNSARGADALLAAPGVQIQSVFIDDQWARHSGTSFAAAIGTGYYALALSTGQFLLPQMLYDDVHTGAQNNPVSPANTVVCGRLSPWVFMDPPME